jgi:hypothetical protein
MAAREGPRQFDGRRFFDSDYAFAAVGLPRTIK